MWTTKSIAKNFLFNLKFLMISVCVVNVCSDFYLDFLHAFRFSFIRLGVVFLICFFVVKKKPAAKIGYYVLSGIIILMGIISIILGYIKYSKGILWKVQYQALFVYIGKAIFQVVSLILFQKAYEDAKTV